MRAPISQPTRQPGEHASYRIVRPDKAIELAGNTAETAYLIRRRDRLG